MQRLLEPGDEPIEGGLHACSRVFGLDKYDGIALLCASSLYVIENFRLDSDGRPVAVAPSVAGSGFGAHSQEAAAASASATSSQTPVPFVATVQLRPAQQTAAQNPDAPASESSSELTSPRSATRTTESESPATLNWPSTEHIPVLHVQRPGSVGSVLRHVCMHLSSCQ